MMEPEEQAKIDQAFATMADNMPSLWRRLYESLKEKGFGDGDSLKLVQTYILSQAPNGVRGADG